MTMQATVKKWIESEMEVADSAMASARTDYPKWVVASVRKDALRSSLETLEHTHYFEEWINLEIRRSDWWEGDPKAPSGVACNTRIAALKDVYVVYKYESEMTAQATVKKWIESEMETADSDMIEFARVDHTKWAVAERRKSALRRSLEALEYTRYFEEWIKLEIRKSDWWKGDPKSITGMAVSAYLTALKDIYAVYKRGPEQSE